MSTTSWLSRHLGCYSLPYEYDALEPHISASTLKLHHLNEHVPHIEKLRRAKNKMKRALNHDVDRLEAAIRLSKALEHSGGVHINHSIYWRSMCKEGCDLELGGKLHSLIAESKYGNREALWKALTSAALSIPADEKGGWCWLALEKGQGVKIQVVTTRGESPLETETGNSHLIPKHLISSMLYKFRPHPSTRH